MSCRTQASRVSKAATHSGLTPGASQSAYQSGQSDAVGPYLPRCQGCKRFISPKTMICRRDNCSLKGQPQPQPLPWPPPGAAFKPKSQFWRGYAGQIKAAVKAWRSGADDRALARVRSELALALAEQTLDNRCNGHPAGLAGALAEERATLLLSPPKSITIAERVERLAIVDNALAWLRLKRAIDDRQYRAALVETLLERQAEAKRSRAEVTWRPDRPVGAEEESASQVDPTRKIKVRYRVVDLDEPIASNQIDGNINPAYDQRLQPRRRERAASLLQIEAIAQKLDPAALLKPGAGWDDGPPLVGPDGMVESGNGRLLALRRAAEINPEGYAAYRQRLLDCAAKFGLDRTQVESMERPILVRERLTKMDEEQRLHFVTEANASGVARMGSAEQARADAALIPPGFFADLDVADGDGSLAEVLTKVGNRPVVARFLKMLPETERAALLDAQGGLSADGVSRLERAMFAYAMPGPSGERLARLVFEEAEAIHRVGAGLKWALPRLGQMENLIRAGRHAPELSLGDDLAAAVEKLRDVHRQGLSVNDYLRQYKMYPELTPVQEQLLVQLDARRYSGRRVAELLNGYAEAVMQTPSPKQMGMFGAGPLATREGLLRTALKQVGGEWVDLSRWSTAQRATSGLGLPAAEVQALSPARQGRGLDLARQTPAAAVRN